MQQIKQFLFIAILLGCTAGVSATNVKETRKTSAFKKINVSGGIDVYFTQDNKQSIEVEAEAEIIGDIVVRVEGETLVVKQERKKGKFFRKNKVVNVYITAPELEDISVSGGSDFFSKEIKCKSSCDISLSGGADVNIDKLTVPGETRINSSGGADCEVKELKTLNCSLNASGGADIEVTIQASGTLRMNASGGADISAKGKVKEVDALASGGADISIRGLSYETINSKASGGADINR